MRDGVQTFTCGVMSENDPAGNQVDVGCKMGVGLRIETGDTICKTYSDLQNR